MYLWIVIGIIVALFALRFYQLGSRRSYASIAKIQEVEGKPVELVLARKGDLEVWTTLAGTVEGSVQYPIVSTNSIPVVEVMKKEGDKVKPGDVLLRLQTLAPNPMLHSYDRSLAVFKEALNELERARNLYAEGAISKQALDKAELAFEVAKTDLNNASGSTQLRATHAGIVTSVLVKEGEMAQAYVPLMWVARTDSVRVSFSAGSRQAVALRKGQKAVWRSPSNSDSGVGIISRLDLAADPKSHLLRGEALFPNREGVLIPGLLLSFDVLTGSRSGVIKIPAIAVVERNNKKCIFVAETSSEGQAVARLRNVEVGLATSDEVEIRSGLKAGERVVIFGQSNLEDGDRVKIVRGMEEGR